ncbi:MAG TPA: tripartite tricarboxylate transporter permease, partial [Microbacterium sp.]|nr:tripartite tricarboxylate transporter permease [Microbacterium sp.]
MDTLGLLADGFAAALTAENIMWVLVGVLVGTIVGILPGLGSVTAVALLLPFTFGLSPLSGLIMLCGVYFGSQYGSSTTAILVRTPGEMGSVVTAIDGYEMALRGRAGPALFTAAIGSFLAASASIVALTFLAPVFARMAISFGAAEYFLLMMLALVLVANLTTGSTLKAVIAALFGLWLATVGTDAASGVARYTFGNLHLLNGIDFIVVAIALFGMAEAFRVLARPDDQKLKLRPVGRITMSREDWRRSSWPWTRGAVLGFLVGVLPGAGGGMASFGSYILEKGLARKDRKAEFGHGAIEGVAGPEAANNAGVCGALVPMFTLGIPGSATTALLLFVFTMHGLQPGPQLFQTNPALIFGIIASLYIGNIALLVLNLPLVGLFARLLRVPQELLFPGVAVSGVLGAYALGFDPFDLYLLFGFSIIGYLMDRYDFSAASALLAMVLGPLIEQN